MAVIIDQGTIELIAFIGAALGIAGRTIMPYLKSRTEEDGNLKFETKYIFSAAYSAILSIAGSMFLWPQLIPTLNPAMSTFAIFILSFTTGWASNDVINFIQGSLSPSDAVLKLQTKPVTTTTTTTTDSQEQPKLS